MNTTDTATDILQHYEIADADIVPVTAGIINTTYKVTSRRGTFILQRMHKMFDERVVLDYAIIQQHLQSRGIAVPPLVQSIGGECFVKNDAIWRLFPYVEHDDVAIDVELAWRCGRALGELHTALATLVHRPRFSIPGFHDTKSIIAHLTRVVASDYGKFSSVVPEFECIVRHVSQHYLRAPRQLLIHGDPKFANFLIRDRRIVAIIDFDTLMIGDPLLDVGDALRSWSSKRNGRFDEEILNTAIRGYVSVCPQDDAQCRDAAVLITLELAARFLIDYFEESYFQWDKTRFGSAAEFNLFRCREQLALYFQMMRSVVGVEV